MGRIFGIVVSFLLIFQQVGFAEESNIVNPKKIYTYEALQQDLIELGNTYPQLLDIRSIGKSHFGRKIYAVKLGKGKENILFIGAHHGREWMTTSLLMEMVEDYSNAYGNKQSYGEYSTDILDEISIWFVPMLNPDGVTIQQGLIKKYPAYYQFRLRMMNKYSHDFSRWKANGKGVDLNRQYPAGWEELSEKPAFPSYQFYKGRRPLEAKEVKIMTDFTKEKEPLLAVAYHSSGREVYWKYKNGKHLERDKKVAEKVAKMTGYKLTDPPKDAYGGGYTDWFITTFHRPGLTIEICPVVNETNPPLSDFKEEWERNRYVGLLLAHEMKKMSKNIHNSSKKLKTNSESMNQ